jgi:hypothetical protein
MIMPIGMFAGIWRRIPIGGIRQTNSCEQDIPGKAVNRIGHPEVVAAMFV